MKNIKIAIMLVAGALFAFAANAEENGELNAGSSSTIAPTNANNPDGVCSLLANAVRINLSSNVEGYYSCDFANSDIRVGTCHVAGSRAEQTVSCTVVSAAGDPIEYSDSNCTSTDDATYTDRSAFIATSIGGSVSQTAMGGATCTGENLGGLNFFN